MIRTCTTSTEDSLLSLAAYKVAIGTTSTAADDKLTDALKAATAVIEAYIGYPLRRQVYSESVRGYGGLELAVSRTPVLSIEKITHDDEVIDSTSYGISNAAGGLIYRDYGWQWTVPFRSELTLNPIVGNESRTYTVVYEAGYCVNGSTDGGWLTTGEPVPSDLQRAIAMTATFLSKSAGRDASETSRRIGDLSISWGGSQPGIGGGGGSIGLPDTVKGLLSQYVRY